MSEEAREAQNLREELARSRETIEALDTAMKRSMGRIAITGFLNSLLLATVVGITVYAAVRLALRHAATP